MTKRNPNMAKLQAGYLFPEIGRRRRALLEKNPKADIISLGIGNTTEPITPYIIKGFLKEVDNLASPAEYTGYDDDQKAQDFLLELKKRIAKNWYNDMAKPEEIFVSDGSKPDCGRLQVMFGNGASIAVQDPAYPVYVDGSVIIGATGNYNKNKEQFDGIYYMACTPENDFFPDLSKQPATDLIYFCNPNNPTGAVSTKEQLKKLVDFALQKKSIIVYDSAYSAFIKDKSLPRSIFEIDGARECAMEICSLSKPAGFTGVRLGWSIIPKELKFECGTPVIQDWSRIMSTLFNGSSNIAQFGALNALDDAGMKEIRQVVGYYMENASIIKKGLTDLGIKAYGGDNAPYIWAHYRGRDSWEVFSEILEKAHVVTTPGAGFGPSGRGFIRFSAFGHRENVVKAVERLKTRL